MQFLLFILGITVKQISQEPVICDGVNETYASEFIFIGAEAGIMRFDRTTKTWGRITTLTGLPDNDINIIALNEGIIWVGTEKGIASADVRLNDWQVYPFDFAPTGIDFDDDYVWVSGESGLLRMDKYTERWDTIITDKINALYSEQERLWLGTDEGILSYNRQFERVEKIPDIPSIKINFIISTPQRIWFLSDSIFLCYEQKSKSWYQYPGGRVKDYQNIGDSLFLLTDSKFIYFNPRTGNWHEFIELGDIGRMIGFSANYKNLIFATESGILLYDLKERSMHKYTAASGLTGDTIIDVYEDNRFIFAISRDKIQYLDKETGIWQIERFGIVKARPKRFFYYDESGLHVHPHKDADLRLQGRIYHAGMVRLSDSGVDTIFYRNINVKLLAEHESNRLLSVYYDDTDKELVMYGFGYRGLETDLIYRLNGGYLNSEYYELNIVPEFTTLGGNVKFKYQEHLLDFQGGFIKSDLKKDFFYGRYLESVDTIMDIDFQKNIFYYIYDGPRKINKGFDTIFIDDRISTNNDIDTRVGLTIAGITGDFDPYINGIDYMVDYENGIIHFLRMPISSSPIIVILLNGEEIVIKSDSVSGHQIENIYSLVPEIVPNTVEMTIIDTTGEIHPLSEFGLDMDNDGKIDPQFVNCDIGYLRFPSRRPFPHQVYDDTIHIYSMIVRYSTRMAFYRLSFSPVLPGSERVYVDGTLMTSGVDYILDYTSGRLIFIKKGMVTDLSEIEIQYMALERAGDEIYYAFQPNLRIADGINIAPGMAVISSESLLFFTGRMEKNVENRGIKFIPRIAFNEKKSYAQKYDMLINYGIVGLMADYSSFDKGFETFGINKKRYGLLDKEYGIGVKIEPTGNIRLEGNHRREYQSDSLNSEYSIQYNDLRITYLNPVLPNLYLSLGRDFLTIYDKTKIQIGTNYNAELKELRWNFNAVINDAQLEPKPDSKIYNDRVTEYYINTNLSLPFPANLNINFRDSKLYHSGEETNDEKEMRFTANVDVIPGLYYTSNYEGNVLKYNLIKTRDFSLKSYFYNSVNIAPGRWHSRMSLINLGLGMGKSFSEYLSNMQEDYKLPLLLIKPVKDRTLSSINNSNNYFISLHLTPFNELLLLLKKSVTETGYSYYTISSLTPVYTDEIKIEYDARNFGLFNVYYTRKRAHSYPKKIDHNLYFLWSRSLFAFLRTKIYTDFQHNTGDYGWIKDERYKVKLGSELLFQPRDRSLFYINLAGTTGLGDFRQKESSVIPGAGFNLNLIEFLYIQFDYQSEFSQSTTNHNISVKVIGQL
ncbi:MAG: hypothetical protein N3A65_07870 [candidate division WOR-3 bacterium]|nr:hypothetical protein [candidate division WOR-3 bacterium]